MNELNLKEIEYLYGGSADHWIGGACAAIGITRFGIGSVGSLLGFGAKTLVRTVVGGPVGIALLAGAGACLAYGAYQGLS